MFIFIKKRILKNYFLHNKITLPIIKNGKRESIFTHVNANDIKKLQETINDLIIAKMSHKKYDFIFHISIDDTLQIIAIDEAFVKSDVDAMEILFDILKNNNWGHNIIQSKHNNIIEVNFNKRQP